MAIYCNRPSLKNNTYEHFRITLEFFMILFRELFSTFPPSHYNLTFIGTIEIDLLLHELTSQMLRSDKNIGTSREDRTMESLRMSLTGVHTHSSENPSVPLQLYCLHLASKPR